MAFQDELGLLIRARYPLLYIPTTEEERAEGAISLTAQALGNRPVYVWDFVDGYLSLAGGNPNDAGFGRRNPLQALEFIEKLPATAAAIFVLRDFNRFLDDVAISRKLRNLSRLLKSQAKTIIVLSAQLEIPSDLSELLTVTEFPLPDVDEIRGQVETLLQATNSQLSDRVRADLVRSCQGLSMERIQRVLARGIATHGTFQAEDIDLILEEKRQSIRQTQILDFYPAAEQISDIGGLDNLKDWLLKRGGAFSERARQYGLPHPRGLMLVGIQGTGKSLTAKAISH
ncbi:MAG: AAA family ATPase, partial [Cyanobacteria bacterium J06632_22]